MLRKILGSIFLLAASVVAQPCDFTPKRAPIIGGVWHFETSVSPNKSIWVSPWVQQPITIPGVTGAWYLHRTSAFMPTRRFTWPKIQVFVPIPIDRRLIGWRLHAQYGTFTNNGTKLVSFSCLWSATIR